MVVYCSAFWLQFLFLLHFDYIEYWELSDFNNHKNSVNFIDCSVTNAYLKYTWHPAIAILSSREDNIYLGYFLP